MKNYLKVLSVLILVSLVNVSGQLHATEQAQDGTPAERDILIINELLPGTYNNANQAYFDVRLKAPEAQRHTSFNKTVSKVDAPAFGEYVYLSQDKVGSGDDAVDMNFLYAFSVDNAAGAVRMKPYRLNKAPKPNRTIKRAEYIEGCDLLWKQEAGQFKGQLESDECYLFPNKNNNGDKSDFEILLTPDAFWLKATQAKSHYAMDKARNFSCYVDVPGVGGGRDTPFERYRINDLSDLGGEQWIKDKDGTDIGISLFRVMWTANNDEGVFTRPSFVIYVKVKDEDGKSKEVGYSWTSPDAQRIGINLKWMLANCYLISNEDVTPFFKTNEPKL